MEHLIDRIRDGLARNTYINERAVSTSIVVPILRALGWDDSDPQEVLPEHTTGRGRVDYALRASPSPNIAAFVEVKGVGRSGEADRQLFEYAFHEGVQLAVLTDGREWNIYLPAEQGSYDDRRAYQLVLDERDPSESASRLRRYLQRDRLASGAAIEDAKRDYRDARSLRQAAGTMPQAWDRLLADADPAVLARLLEETEALCGFRPGDEQAIAFLQGKAGDVERRSAQPPRRISRAAAAPVPALLAGSPTAGERYRWIVRDASGAGRNAVDAFIAYLDAVFAAAPDHVQQMTAAARTRSRNNIAATLEDVYPKQPDIAAKSHRRLSNGLYVGTNLSNASKVMLARQIAEAAGLKFGSDAVLEL